MMHIINDECEFATTYLSIIDWECYSFDTSIKPVEYLPYLKFNPVQPKKKPWWKFW